MAEGGWFSRLKAGLSRSSSRLADGIGGIFTKRRLDSAALEELEELLILADMGVECAAALTGDLAATRLDKDITPEEVRETLAVRIADILDPIARPKMRDEIRRLHDELGATTLYVTHNVSDATTMADRIAIMREGKVVQVASLDVLRSSPVEPYVTPLLTSY